MGFVLFPHQWAIADYNAAGKFRGEMHITILVYPILGSSDLRISIVCLVIAIEIQRFTTQLCIELHRYIYRNPQITFLLKTDNLDIIQNTC